MTTGAPAPARVPTPRPKAPATASLNPESAVASGTAATTTTPKPKVTEPSSPLARTGTPKPNGLSQPGARRGQRATPSDPLSDKVTAHLIRRILCPDQQLDKDRNTSAPIEELLPPLTSRNDVDLQLYALIAIILKEYVQKWYNKITPDETFVAEVVQTIAHVTRALEQRIRKVDLESLLFDEIPDLLDKHVNTFRAAHSSVAQPPIETDPCVIYHSMWPLPALSPVPNTSALAAIAEQAENEAAYRQLLVQGVLALLLPTEDLENNCLTSLVGQIFSELIIGNIVSNKLAEPWLLYEVLVILANVIRRKDSDPSPAQSTTANTSANLQPTSAKRSSSIQGLFLSILQWCFFAANIVRVVVATVISSRSIPRRTRYYNARSLTGNGAQVTRPKTTAQVTDAADGLSETPPAEPVKVPVLAFRIWSAISNLIEFDLRMPWLCGTMSFLQWMAIAGPGRMADVDGVLDRLCSHAIQTKLLDPATLPPLLRTVRASLFPQNAPAGTSSLIPPSSEAELVALKRRCAKSLWELVPKSLGGIYFGSSSGGVVSSSEVTPLHSRSQYQRSVENKGPGELARTVQGDGKRSGPDDVATNRTRDKERKEGGAGIHRTTNEHEQRRDRKEQIASTMPPSQTEGTAVGSMYTDRDAQENEEEGRILTEIERGILDVFGDAYCNKHLMYSIIELVLVRLMPELAERGVQELWQERIG